MSNDNPNYLIRNDVDTLPIHEEVPYSWIQYIQFRGEKKERIQNQYVVRHIIYMTNESYSVFTIKFSSTVPSDKIQGSTYLS